MLNKLNLKCDDRVELHTMGQQMSGKKGTVIGVSIRHIIDFYIVLFDEPIVYDDFVHKAASIPESCLKRI